MMSTSSTTTTTTIITGTKGMESSENLVLSSSFDGLGFGGPVPKERIKIHKTIQSILEA